MLFLKQVTFKAKILNHFLRRNMVKKIFKTHFPPQKMVQNNGFVSDLLFKPQNSRIWFFHSWLLSYDEKYVEGLASNHRLPSFSPDPFLLFPSFLNLQSSQKWQKFCPGLFLPKSASNFPEGASESISRAGRPAIIFNFIDLSGILLFLFRRENFLDFFK